MALVRVRGPLKKLAGDRSEHEIEGETVGDLLRTLEQEHPGVAGWVLDERGAIRRHINVFVNGERGGIATAVGDRDRIEVLPAITGGASDTPAITGGASDTPAITGGASDTPAITGGESEL